MGHTQWCLGLPFGSEIQALLLLVLRALNIAPGIEVGLTVSNKGALKFFLARGQSKIA